VALLVVSGCTRGEDEVETGSEGSDGGSGEPAEDGGEAPEGDFGSLEGVCGDGDASGSTAQGVTDDEIAIATFSDPGFAARPGLNQELFDAAQVFSQWCNDAGGINGREIVVHERDAALTEVPPRMTESCREDFMMVGGGAVFDDTGQETRLSCLLPDIAGYVVTPAARGADLLVQPIPNGLETTFRGVQLYLDEAFPESGENVGYLTANIPATVVVNDQTIEVGESVGWTTVYNGTYNAAGETSWVPFAQELQSNGVRGLNYTGEPQNLAALLQALADIGYELDWIHAGANHYDQGLIETAGSLANNVYVNNVIVPFELAGDEHPATEQYLELFEEYLPDGKARATLAINAFSAWLLFATSATECGTELTRSCVFENAKAVEEWTAGGLHAPTNPGSGQSSECFVPLQGAEDGFVVPEDLEANEGIFNCSPDNVFELEGDYGTGAKLEDVGLSIDDLE
jgi:hypothetical protein